MNAASGIGACFNYIKYVKTGDEIERTLRPRRESRNGWIVATNGFEDAKRSHLLDETALAATVIEPAQVFGAMRPA